MILLGNKREAIVEDFKDQKRLTSFKADEASAIATVFFDRNSQAKALLFRFDGELVAGLELWDLASRIREWKNSDLPRWHCLYAASTYHWLVAPHSAQTRLYSMKDGRLLKSMMANYMDENELDNSLPIMTKDMLSEGGYYYLTRRATPSILSPLARLCRKDGWLSELRDLLALQYSFLRSRTSFIVQDVETEKTWSINCGADGACFRVSDACLTTLQVEGAYDWDLPPRQRWFTPWAWPSLAITLALTWYLWPWGRRLETTRKSLAAVCKRKHNLKSNQPTPHQVSTV